MISITNEKVAGFEPRWAPFSGFSLLFDSPGQSLSPLAAPAGKELLKLDCPVETADTVDGLHFYRRLVTGLNKLGLDLLINTYLFCPLPPYSYHVTVLDGFNVGNASHVSLDYRRDLETYLGNMPASFAGDETFTAEILESPLLSRPEWAITFKLGEVVKWGNIGLVALVVPADPASEQTFNRIVEARGALYEQLNRRYGTNFSSPYYPHVSLGYFANKEQAELSSSQIGRWADVIRGEVGDLTITYPSISLYGFTDMVTFYKNK